MIEQSSPVDSPRGCYGINCALNVVLGLFIGGCIFLFLTVLHRSAWSALLAGFLGTIISCVLVLRQWLLDRRPGASSSQDNVRVMPWTGPLDTRGQTIAVILVGLLVIALGVGLYFLPDQQPIFVLLSAVLGLLLCISLFFLGLLILTFFLARGDRHNIFVAIPDDPSAKEKEAGEENS